MENKKVLGMDSRTLLMLGWLVQIFVPVGGLIGAIVLMYYFQEEKNRDTWLSSGFKDIANFSLVMYIVSAILATSATILMFIPLIGLISMILMFVLIGIISIYSLYVYIKGALAAGNGQLYRPKYSFEIFK